MVQGRESVPPEEGSTGNQAAALKLVMALKKDLISISPLESEMNASLNHQFFQQIPEVFFCETKKTEQNFCM